MSSKVRSRLYYKICVASAFLIIVGTAIVLSSSTGYAISRTGDPTYYFERHLVWLVLGGLAMFFMSKLGVRKIEQNNFLLFGIFIGSLLLLLVPIVTGNLRWIIFGPFSFQPAELVKLTFLLYLADYLRRKHQDIKEPKVLMKPLGFFLFIAFVLQLQKDLGTFVVLFLVFCLLLFLAGLPRKYLVSLAAAGLAMLVLLVLLFPYRIERIKTYLNPSLDPQGKGYQTNQARLALEEGGLLGKGIGGGDRKLKYLPEAHKDYVYAIVGEEMGFWGTTLVLFFFVVLTVAGFELALESKNEFDRFLAAGLGSLFGFQFLLHASVVLSIIPSKGTTLPFFSVGGSSLLVNLLALGILLDIARQTCFSTYVDSLEEYP